MKVFALLLPVLIASAAHAGEPEATVSVDRIHEILAKARPHLVRLTGLTWPEELVVLKTDVESLADVLREEFDAQTRSLQPGLDPSRRARTVAFLSRAFARSLRAKYGLRTKKIHVSEGALSRLPEGVKADDALTWIVLHEAVHAMDDEAADLGEMLAEIPSAEALRAWRMVVEGRAELFGALAAEAVGVSALVGRAFEARRSPGERLTRSAGRAFVEALLKRGSAQALEALRSPPTTTTTVLHPERYGSRLEHPDPGAVLGMATGREDTEPLSELMLRVGVSVPVSPDIVEKAFSGYLAGATLNSPGGRHLSLVVLTDEDSAAEFLDCLRRYYGGSPAIKDRVAAGVLPPDHRFALKRRGRWVAEALVDRNEDSMPVLELVLEKAAETDASHAPGTPSPK